MSRRGTTDAERVAYILQATRLPDGFHAHLSQALHETPRRDLCILYAALRSSPGFAARWQMRMEFAALTAARMALPSCLQRGVQ